MSMEGEKRYEEMERWMKLHKVRVIPQKPVVICARCVKTKRYCECKKFVAVTR